MVFRHMDDVQEILSMFFREIYEDTVMGKRKAAGCNGSGEPAVQPVMESQNGA